FVRVWAGSIVSGTGDEITLLALPWLVLQLTHSPFQLGVVAGLQHLPFLVFTLIAGVYADRWDRRHIMLGADLLRFASLATIPLAALFNVLTIAQIYVVAVLAGTGRVGFDVAHYALLPGIVRSEEHTYELQSLRHLVCRLLLEKKNNHTPPARGYRPPHTAG